jgi:hypothetical protein
MLTVYVIPKVESTTWLLNNDISVAAKADQAFTPWQTVPIPICMRVESRFLK